MKKGFTLAEVLMAKRTSGIENNILHSRESEPKEPSSKIKKLAAFTLAEVLITLAIIGVVAALTIPTVIAKYQQHALYTQFMKAYSNLSKVIQLVFSQDGPLESITEEDISDDELFNKYFAEHFNIASVDDIPTYSVKDLGGQVIVNFNQFIVTGATKNYSLADGSTICLARRGNDIIVFAIDTNGAKAPNTLGRDIFSFAVEKDSNHVKDYLFGGEWLAEDDNDACSVDGNGGEIGIKGAGCADRLIKEGKMNY